MSFGKDPMIQRKGDNSKNGKKLDEFISAQRNNEKKFSHYV